MDLDEEIKSREEGEIGSESREKGDLLPLFLPPHNGSNEYQCQRNVKVWQCFFDINGTNIPTEMCNLHSVIWLASMKNEIACGTKQNINIVDCCDDCWSINNVFEGDFPFRIPDIRSWNNDKACMWWKQILATLEKVTSHKALDLPNLHFNRTEANKPKKL